jgi:hypothetical protein
VLNERGVVIRTKPKGAVAVLHPALYGKAVNRIFRNPPFCHMSMGKGGFLYEKTGKLSFKQGND